MLIKAKPTKKRRAAFITPDATEREIAEFVSFLNEGAGSPASPGKAGRPGAGKKKAAGRKGSRPA